MEMQLSEAEVKMILKARKSVRYRIMQKLIVLAMIITLVMLESSSIIETKQAFVACAFLAFAAGFEMFSFSGTPTYKELLSLIEKKVYESSNAIKVFNEIKRVTIG